MKGPRPRPLDDGDVEEVRQHVAGQTIAEDPQDLRPNIGLEAVQGKADTSVGLGNLLEAEGIGPGERHKFVVALEEMLDRPEGHGDVAASQLLMHLGNAPVLGIA